MIGGVALLCCAPNVVRAEDGAIFTEKGRHATVISNINIADETTPTPLPVNPVLQPAIDSRSVAVPLPEQYRALVDAISRNNSVDPDLIDAMIRTESNYNRWAISSKGARGLMQLIPETGRRFGVQDFFDPRQNIEGGVRYIRYLLDMFDGNVDLSLAAYNAGENLVARLGKIPPFPETRNYVRKIRAVFTKPSAVATVSSATIVSVAATKQKSPVIAAIKDSLASNGLPARVQEVPSAPISSWMDERGVHHFSNLGPAN